MVGEKLEWRVESSGGMFSTVTAARASRFVEDLGTSRTLLLVVVPELDDLLDLSELKDEDYQSCTKNSDLYESFKISTVISI